MQFYSERRNCRCSLFAESKINHLINVYALSGGQIILRFPPTFIPMIPSSQAGITILNVRRLIRTSTRHRDEEKAGLQFQKNYRESVFRYSEFFLYG